MSNTTYIALSGQMALRRQMEVLANNIANASTPAFKSEQMLFAEYLEKEPTERPLSFVQDIGTARDTRQGSLSKTGNSLDVGLQGDGYLAVQTPMGIRYTRNGHLQLDANGQLVTTEGYPVLAEGDQPLAVPSDAGEITISRDGIVSTRQGQAGRLSVVTFPSERDLKPAGNGLYVTNSQPQPATGTLVLQGMLEDSNVKPILAMTRMMQVAQNFELAKQMVDGESERVRNAIEKLGKVA
jgi:flagellar basal-body rod protein FlgF